MNLCLLFSLFFINYLGSVYGENGESATLKNLSLIVPYATMKGNMEKYINICCKMDLDNPNQSRCRKFAHDEIVTASTSLNLPSHLMAENATTKFNLAVKFAMCRESDVNLVEMDLDTSSKGRGSSLFLKNGYLKVENHFYHQDEYCINGKNDSILEILVCPQNCKGPRPCIVKCCGLDKVYSFPFSPNAPTKGCQNPGEDYFSPELYSDFTHVSKKKGRLAPHFIEKYPSTFKFECYLNKTTFFVFPETSQIIANHVGLNLTGHPFRIRDDGKFLYQEPDGRCEVVDPLTTNICIDGIMNYGPTSEPFENKPNDFVIFLCSLSPVEGEADSGGYLYGSLMIGSSIFLFLTIAVYFMLWERQNVHGWTILSHTISLFFMYIFVGTAHILRVTKGHSILNTSGCFFVGVMAHYFFLATFCWLSQISIDLWLTFRAITPRRGGTQSKGFKRYSLYSIFGWGVPAIIVGVGWSLTRKTEHSCSNVISPAYGMYNCYIQEKAAGIYLYFPIAAMMFINILFFAITSVKLYMYRSSTKMATKDDTQEQFYRLFFKLFFVMGVLYIFELISWGVSGTGFFWYWGLFDLLNILRAVAVFIIFVCKPDILWALEQKYSWLKPCLIPFECITRKKRTFSQRHDGASESIGLNSSLSTKQSTLRTSTSTRSALRVD